MKNLKETIRDNVTSRDIYFGNYDFNTLLTITKEYYKQVFFDARIKDLQERIEKRIRQHKSRKFLRLELSKLQHKKEVFKEDNYFNNYTTARLHKVLADIKREVK